MVRFLKPFYVLIINSFLHGIRDCMFARQIKTTNGSLRSDGFVVKCPSGLTQSQLAILGTQEHWLESRLDGVLHLKLS